MLYSYIFLSKPSDDMMNGDALICDDEDDPPPNSWDLGAALQDLQIADPGKEIL